MSHIHDYSTGKIYMIICNITGLRYVGSTKVPLKDRLNRHETDYRGYMGLLNKPRNFRGSAECIINGDYNMYLLQDYPCETRKQLEHQESKWMLFMSQYYNLTNKCMPSMITFEDFKEIETFKIPLLV